MEAMRKIHTSLMLDPTLVNRLDQAAAVRDRSRSWLAGQAIEQFLQSDGTRPPPELAPPGGVSSAMPGTPPASAGRGLGHSCPLESLPGSIFHQETIMTADPYREMKSEDVERVRQLQQQHGARQVNNQDRCNTEVNSPAPTVYQPAPGEPR
jgi:hypothetical protein